jgi:hypothetical protein
MSRPAAALKTAPSPSAQALDDAARLLLMQLAAETRKAEQVLEAEGGDALYAILGARDRMLVALEGIGGALGPSATPAQARAELVVMAAELQRANVALMQRVQGECDRLAGAIAALDRPDGVAGAYGVAAVTTHLDLMR